MGVKCGEDCKGMEKEGRDYANRDLSDMQTTPGGASGASGASRINFCCLCLPSARRGIAAPRHAERVLPDFHAVGRSPRPRPFSSPGNRKASPHSWARSLKKIKKLIHTKITTNFC